MPFKVFLGIDQSAAIHKDGSPRPLPVAAIYKTDGTWTLESDLALAHLNKNSIESLVKELNPRTELSDAAILIDSVLGLPRNVFPKNKSIYDLMVRAHRFSSDGKRIEAKTANAFFAQFVENVSGPPPRRECEIKLDRSSIFASQPFQRNLGVGTFRSWSELGSSQHKWFSLWPFDDAEKPGPWVFEASPEYFWKTVVKTQKRDCAVLKEFLAKQKYLQIHSSILRSLQDPDLCDAIVLCYCGFVLNKRRQLFKTPKSSNLKKEGWILGV